MTSPRRSLHPTRPSTPSQDSQELSTLLSPPVAASESIIQSSKSTAGGGDSSAGRDSNGDSTKNKRKRVVSDSVETSSNDDIAKCNDLEDLTATVLGHLRHRHPSNPCALYILRAMPGSKRVRAELPLLAIFLLTQSPSASIQGVDDLRVKGTLMPIAPSAAPDYEPLRVFLPPSVAVSAEVLEKMIFAAPPVPRITLRMPAVIAPPQAAASVPEPTQTDAPQTPGGLPKYLTAQIDDVQSLPTVYLDLQREPARTAQSLLADQFKSEKQLEREAKRRKKTSQKHARDMAKYLATRNVKYVYYAVICSDGFLPEKNGVADWARQQRGSKARSRSSDVVPRVVYWFNLHNAGWDDTEENAQRYIEMYKAQGTLIDTERQYRGDDPKYRPEGGEWLGDNGCRLRWERDTLQYVEHFNLSVTNRGVIESKTWFPLLGRDRAPLAKFGKYVLPIVTGMAGHMAQKEYNDGIQYLRDSYHLKINCYGPEELEHAVEQVEREMPQEPEAEEEVEWQEEQEDDVETESEYEEEEEEEMENTSATPIEAHRMPVSPSTPIAYALTLPEEDTCDMKLLAETATLYGSSHSDRSGLDYLVDAIDIRESATPSPRISTPPSLINVTPEIHWPSDDESDCVQDNRVGHVPYEVEHVPKQQNECASLRYQ